VPLRRHRAGGGEADLNGAVDLSKYDNSWYNPGRGFAWRTVWFATNAWLLQTNLHPSSRLRVLLLRSFGAKVGHGAVMKPGINVKYPWNLSIGDCTWIGKQAWLDSLARIEVGSHVCISQGAYLCTGNHDWSDPAFGLMVKPIVIEDGAWVGARAVVLPGVTVASHSVVASGAVLTQDTEPYTIYSGNPEAAVRRRTVRPLPGQGAR